MRLLMKEQPYEKRIAAGTLRYEREGQPTGTLEHWRYNHAMDGYKFLRFDLDSREASGDTFLCTILVDTNGRLENVRWRFYNGDFRARGQILFEGNHATAVREVAGEQFEAEVVLTNGMAFFVPAVMGLWLFKDQVVQTAVMLDKSQRQPAAFMKLISLPAQLEAVDNGFVLYQAEHRYEVALGEHGWPVKVVWPDGLTAVEQSMNTYR